MTRTLSRSVPTLVFLLVAFLATSSPAASAATNDPTARAAADRTARDLAATGHVLGGGTDLTLTLDAIVLFAAAGVSGDAVKLSVDRTVEHQGAYLAGAASGDHGRRAKLAYVLQVAGRDATPLLAELRASIQADGRFGTATTPFGQAFGVLALARTAEGAPGATITYLESKQCTTVGHANHGGFSFSGCASADGDMTGVAVSALLAGGRSAGDPSVAAALGWLQRRQNPDGSFGMSGSVAAGNVNSTGYAAYAARQIGTPPAVAVADAAAAYVRELQVTCASPIIAGDDPSVGGGFVASWHGAVAYDAAAQDGAVTYGIRSGQYTQWRYATLQAPLAMPGLASMRDATLDPAAPAVAAAPACPVTSTPAVPTEETDTGGDTGARPGSSRPAAQFRVRTAPALVPVGARTTITATGLAPGEPWRLLVSGRLVARGTATARGTVLRRFVVPRTLGTHHARIVRLLGSTGQRSGTTTLATAAPRTLLAVPPRPVRAGSTVRIAVRGLLPREPWHATSSGRRIQAGTAARTGVASVAVRVTAAAGARQRVVVCGVTCTRRAVVLLEVAS